MAVVAEAAGTAGTAESVSRRETLSSAEVATEADSVLNLEGQCYDKCFEIKQAYGITKHGRNIMDSSLVAVSSNLTRRRYLRLSKGVSRGAASCGNNFEPHNSTEGVQTPELLCRRDSLPGHQEAAGKRYSARVRSLGQIFD